MQRPDKLVLVVEDEESLIFLVRKQLKKLGFQADFAKDGEEAVRKSSSSQYSCVLMDVHLPNMSGIEAAKAIRAQESANNQSAVPIIAITADPDRKQCFQAGMNDYLFKPVLIETLRKTLERWLA
jgi:two-component system, sensor histidine kinase and response regulator